METAVAWQKAIEHQGPTWLLLSRQNVPHQDRDKQGLANISRGGYILRDCNEDPEMIMMATGSEVALAVDAGRQLTHAGMNVRVVSMPSVDVFLAQDVAYQESVLPKHVVIFCTHSY